jgi:hypothetical protein
LRGEPVRRRLAGESPGPDRRLLGRDGGRILGRRGLARRRRRGRARGRGLAAGALALERLPSATSVSGRLAAAAATSRPRAAGAADRLRSRSGGVPVAAVPAAAPLATAHSRPRRFPPGERTGRRRPCRPKGTGTEAVSVLAPRRASVPCAARAFQQKPPTSGTPQGFWRAARDARSPPTSPSPAPVQSPAEHRRDLRRSAASHRQSRDGSTAPNRRRRPPVFPCSGKRVTHSTAGGGGPTPRAGGLVPASWTRRRARRAPIPSPTLGRPPPRAPPRGPA